MDILANPFIKKMRSEEDVANDTVGATPPVDRPDRFEQMYRDHNIGRVGASLARAFSEWNEATDRKTDGYYPKLSDSAKPLTPAPQSAPAVARPATGSAVTQSATAAIPLPVPAARTAPMVGTPAGGRADPTSVGGQAFTNSQGQRVNAPAGVTVTRGANGNPVFTATGENIAAANAGQPVAALVATSTAPTQQIQRPAFAGSAQGARIENPDEAERRLDIALSGATFQPARSRGERAAQAQVVDAIAGQAAQRNQIEADANRAQLDANTRTNIAHMGEAGSNYRAELTDAGESSRMREAQAGETLREHLKIDRPTYTTDAQGRYLEVGSSGIARPVVDARGNSVHMPVDGELTPIVRLDSLIKQLDAEQQSLQPNAERLANLREQIDALTPQDKTATNRASGERVRINSRTGEWEPIK